MATEKKHPFHILEPSPWPMLASLGAFLALLGVVLYTHDHSPISMILGLVMLIGVLVMWWRDVIKESKTEHTPQVIRGFEYGMALFIFSEVMFFVSFFWAFFDAALSPTEAMGGVWPPKGIQTLDPFDLPYLNTLLLLFSGTTLTWAHYTITQGDMKDTINKIGITILVSIAFLSVQVLEYMHAPFGFKDGIYPTVFFMSTGFHGFHVLVGTIFLITCWFRARANHFTKDDHFGFEAAAWYWHFVDVVWLFLFVAIYWWGGN
jgi:cytochrome c oxidase subunit 3